MSASYNEIQLDALRELANIGAGTASTALSQMLGHSIDLAVPDARVLPMADAVGNFRRERARDQLALPVHGGHGEREAHAVAADDHGEGHAVVA